MAYASPSAAIDVEVAMRAAGMLALPIEGVECCSWPSVCPWAIVVERVASLFAMVLGPTIFAMLEGFFPVFRE